MGSIMRWWRLELGAPLSLLLVVLSAAPLLALAGTWTIYLSGMHAVWEEGVMWRFRQHALPAFELGLLSVMVVAPLTVAAIACHAVVMLWLGRSVSRLFGAIWLIAAPVMLFVIGIAVIGASAAGR